MTEIVIFGFAVIGYLAVTFYAVSKIAAWFSRTRKPVEFMYLVSFAAVNEFHSLKGHSHITLSSYPWREDSTKRVCDFIANLTNASKGTDFVGTDVMITNVFKIS